MQHTLFLVPASARAGNFSGYSRGSVLAHAPLEVEAKVL